MNLEGFFGLSHYTTMCCCIYSGFYTVMSTANNNINNTHSVLFYAQDNSEYLACLFINCGLIACD